MGTGLALSYLRSLQYPGPGCTGASSDVIELPGYMLQRIPADVKVQLSKP